MAVRWETLQTIAKTEARDVWYLSPLSAVYRQAAKDFDKVDEGKAAKLDAVLGTPDWRTVFYEKSIQDSLLSDDMQSARRTAGPPEIATYIHSRLFEIFQGWVSPPIFLSEVGPPINALARLHQFASLSRDASLGALRRGPSARDMCLPPPLGLVAIRPPGPRLSTPATDA